MASTFSFLLFIAFVLTFSVAEEVSNNLLDNQLLTEFETSSLRSVQNFELEQRRKRYIDWPSDDDFDTRKGKSDQVNTLGGNVDHGQGLSVFALSPQALNNIKAGKRKRYVIDWPYDYEDFDTRKGKSDQSNSGGGDVSHGQSLFASVANPSIGNNIKAGKRKRYIDWPYDYDFDTRKGKSDQSNSGGGDVNHGQSIFASVLNPSALNNIKAGKRKRYIDWPNDYDFDTRKGKSDQFNSGGGDVSHGQSIFASVLNPPILNNIKAGKRKRYIDWPNDYDDFDTRKGKSDQFNSGGGDVSHGQSIFASVLNPPIANNIKAGKRKRYIDWPNDYDDFDTRKGKPDQSNSGGGDVNHGQSIFASVLNPPIGNNIKAGKRKRYIDWPYDYDFDTRKGKSDQINSGGGNVSHGQSIFASLLNPSLLNNIKAGKRKRYVDWPYDYDFDTRKAQSNSGGGDVKHGQSVHASALNPQLLNNVSLGRK